MRDWGLGGRWGDGTGIIFLIHDKVMEELMVEESEPEMERRKGQLLI